MFFSSSHPGKWDLDHTPAPLEECLERFVLSVCVLAISPMENLEPVSGSRTSERSNDRQLIDANDGTHIKNEFLF